MSESHFDPVKDADLIEAVKEYTAKENETLDQEQKRLMEGSGFDPDHRIPGVEEEAYTTDFSKSLGNVVDIRAFGRSTASEEVKFKFIEASRVQEMQVKWAIDQWLACGMVHLLAGQAGRGKTGIALAVAAMITQRKMFPTGTICRQGKVIVWSGEDSLNHTIVPRLRANGADLDKVLFIKADSHGEFDPAVHIPQLDEMIRKMGLEHGVVMMIMDPITRIATKVRNSNDSIQIREALDSLRKFAERTDIAVLGITHFLKRHNAVGSDVLDRVIGSQAWAAVARTVWAVDYVKELQANVLARVKSNIGMDTDDIEYFVQGADYDQRIQKIEFGHLIPNGRELMEGQASDSSDATDIEDKTNAKAEACDFILGTLKYADLHIMTWEELIAAAKGEHSPRTMVRARGQLKKDGLLANPKQGGSKWKLTTKGEQYADDHENEETTS